MVPQHRAKPKADLDSRSIVRISLMCAASRVRNDAGRGSGPRGDKLFVDYAGDTVPGKAQRRCSARSAVRTELSAARSVAR
jgi:hypothetical protein